MRTSRLRAWLCVAALLTSPVLAAPLTRAQAITALAQGNAALRLAGVERLGEIGSMADARHVITSLRDRDARVREAAGTAVWHIWGRSGDAKIDKLYARGVAQMQAATLAEALATFDEIVRLKPDFAEGWNKRATIYFLLGENDKSLQDCEEVFKRNPQHFGALAGAGQIQLQIGNARLALEFFKRALAVNPNLEGAAQVLPLLEQHVREEDRNRI
jgi:tetratricopeptide (TPR) repeat protein